MNELSMNDTINILFVKPEGLAKRCILQSSLVFVRSSRKENLTFSSPSNY